MSNQDSFFLSPLKERLVAPSTLALSSARPRCIARASPSTLSDVLVSISRRTQSVKLDLDARNPRLRSRREGNASRVRKTGSFLCDFGYSVWVGYVYSRRLKGSDHNHCSEKTSTLDCVARHGLRLLAQLQGGGALPTAEVCHAEQEEEHTEQQRLAQGEQETTCSER